MLPSALATPYLRSSQLDRLERLVHIPSVCNLNTRRLRRQQLARRTLRGRDPGDAPMTHIARHISSTA
jgi:hypothetical protein